ncbi:MAG: urease accessory protein UreE [Hyphomicrobiales bacterium]|nr:urease accessory protein UreE [Hyphomicrobiales bacterium]
MQSANVSLPHARQVHRCGTWSGPTADKVMLDYDGRHRRRHFMSGVGGLEFLLDLPKAQHLRGGDALELEDGRLIAIEALPEPLVEVTAADKQALARLAWHIGNRHLQVEVTQGALRIRADRLIEAMLAGLGASLRPIEAPFEPESQAASPPGAAHHAHEHHHP